MSAVSSLDPSSLANLGQIVVEHVALDLAVDFEASILIGVASLTCQILALGVTEIVLDTNDLNISAISVDGKAVEYHLGEEVDPFGTPLHIRLPLPVAPQDRFDVIIHYSTMPQGQAVQWLTPEQTSTGEYPFCFTQCQAIHARSMLPCQDSPSVKATYSAKILVPSPMVALMSAVASSDPIPGSDGKTTFHFEQKIPIPSYLIALAVGRMESIRIGPRSSVWAEPDVVKAASEDFSETEQFLQAAESICGPYEWGTYDILCLPPSFPYGGMENPCLTFVTPTLVTGDKSLANVIAHEIAHSWHGNLVTNRNWENFWLNEGFTVYVERKIMGKIYGDSMFHFLAIGGLQSLQEDIDHFGATNPLTYLCPNLKGIDPDDAFSRVPYEKGFNLLFYLEGLFGRDRFEMFLKRFVSEYRLKTVDVMQFRSSLATFFAGRDLELDQIDWDAWLYTPGMPPIENEFDQSLMQSVRDAAQAYIAGGDASLEMFTSRQLVAFVDTLLAEQSKLGVDIIDRLESAYNFSTTRNSDMRLRWLLLCINLEHSAILPNVLEFITEQGRMKYVRPLYRALFASNFAHDDAIKTFQSNRQLYHPIAAKMICQDLKLS